MRGIVLGLAVALTATPAVGQQPALTGWWRGTVSHAGETKDIYLHFQERGEKTLVRFSIPWIAADDSPLGPYKIEGKNLTFPAAGWAFTLSDDGRSFSGTIPADIIPVYQLKVRFDRSGPPVQPKVAAAGPAPKPMWQARVGSAVFAPLAFDGSTNSVIVATDAGTIFALDPANGRSRWSVTLGSPIRAAPTVTGDGIYVASDAGISKLRKRDGRTIWTRSFTGPLVARKDMSDPASRWDHYGSSVVLSGTIAVAGSRDGCVYAMRRTDGIIQRRICSTDAITSTPVVKDSRVYFTSFDHGLYAASLPNGTILWKANLGAPAPADLVLAGGRIVAGSRTYDLTGHDPATGKVAWRNYSWFSWIDSAPVVDRGEMFIGSSDGLRVTALDPDDGKTIWSSFIGGWAWARPAADAKTIFAGAVGNTNMPYIGPREAGLAAIDRGSGRLKWLFRPPHDPKALISGFAAGPLAVNGRVFAADLEGNVYALPAA